MLTVRPVFIGEQTIYNAFDALIVKTPKEGIMGLTRDKKPIILHNGDMVSMKLLDEAFVRTLYLRGMATPIKIREPKPRQRIDQLKYRRSKKGRAKKNTKLDKWLGGVPHNKW